jgi:large subunit ribosomal protein L5
MSATIPKATATVKAAARGSLRPTRRAPEVRKLLRRDERGLPIPHVKNLILRDTHQSRFQDYYHNTLQDDLMYMTYVHESSSRPPQRPIRLAYDPEDPYTKNRHNPPVGGSQIGKKPSPPSTPQNVVQLERIQIHTMTKEAINSKSSLLGPIAVFRAISGENYKGGGVHTAEGVQIVNAVKTVGGWSRSGAALGVKVDMKGPKMYDFLSTLVEFVLPRMREFNGVQLPSSSSNMQTPSGVSGVVSFGLPPEAMGLFPQIEVNLDSYPNSYGMHIHFITTAEGQGAQNRARALLSGFGVPFIRK